MIKIVFNFKSIYTYALIHVLNAIFLIICLIIYIFIIKIVFNFKCIHALHELYASINKPEEIQSYI